MVKDQDMYGSFTAFTSCSRNRRVTELYTANALFVIDVVAAFTANLVEVGNYPDEEEELVMPGVCFRVTKVEYDCKNTKHLIYSELQQRFSGKRKEPFIIAFKNAKIVIY